MKFDWLVTILVGVLIGLSLAAAIPNHPPAAQPHHAQEK